MRTRPLGSTGLRVSALCLGTMNLGGPTGRWGSGRLVRRALDLGVDFFDTAPTYNAGRSEELLGRALRGRRDVVVATKVFVKEGTVDAGGLRDRITRACEASLRRLGRDAVDLYQLHRPIPDLPQEEVLRAFDELVHAGKVRFVGCSTQAAADVAEALAIGAREGLTAWASEQPPYNLLDRRVERDLVPLCQERGLALLPWSPLAGGVLAGRYGGEAGWPRGSRAARVERYRARVTDRARSVAAAVAERARGTGRSGAQLALAWLAGQPAVTAPIVGPRTVAHLEAAVAALERPVDDEDRAFVDALVPPGTAAVEFA